MTVRELRAFLASLPEDQQDLEFGIEYDSGVCVAWAGEAKNVYGSPAPWCDPAVVVPEKRP